VLGAGLLWFGWFGFNAGSALSSGALATSSFVVTHIAAASAGLTWALLDALFNSRPTMLGMITGVVAGLGAITPAAGFVNIAGALGIGTVAAALAYTAVSFVKARFGYDDALDVFGVHGVGGIWGTVATGIFATKAVNAAGANGLFYGNPGQLWIQSAVVAICAVFSFGMTFVLLNLVDAVMGLRVSCSDERIGLDMTQHREAGYTLVD
jgi:Amt family ammonium transporter